jgi:hypothetical protein
MTDIVKGKGTGEAELLLHEFTGGWAGRFIPTAPP